MSSPSKKNIICNVIHNPSEQPTFFLMLNISEEFSLYLNLNLVQMKQIPGDKENLIYLYDLQFSFIKITRSKK